MIMIIKRYLVVIIKVKKEMGRVRAKINKVNNYVLKAFYDYLLTTKR